MNKLELSDGENAVKSIDVYALFKDNEAYLEFFVDSFAKIEQAYDISIQYFFLENDSKDNTRLILERFLEERKGHIIYPGNKKEFNKLNRLKRMEHLRNKLIKSNSNISSEWSLVIDSDIYFEIGIIKDIFSKNLRKINCGMICAFGTEFYGEYKEQLSTLFHYYDTYTYIDHRRKLYWPHCVFKECQKCQGKLLDTEKIETVGLIEVMSAFGGFAFVDSDLLKNNNIHWESISHSNMMLCEHIGLCLRINAHGGKKVFIDTSSKVYWKCPSDPPSVV
jgi:hypothetical protein